MAKLNETMWTELFMDNADYLGNEIDWIIEELGKYRDALKAGDRVQIVGFGSFEVRERAAHKGRNPSTGEEITIAASKSPVFKAGKNFKDAL